MTQNNEIVIDIPSTPPSANRMWRTNPRGGMYISKDAKAWYDLVRLQTSSIKLPGNWKYYAVAIEIEPRSKRGDVDNRIKTVLDALTKARLWEDDDRVAFVSCEFGRVSKTGRTIVRISEREKKYLS